MLGDKGAVLGGQGVAEEVSGAETSDPERVVIGRIDTGQLADVGGCSLKDLGDFGAEPRIFFSEWPGS